MDINPLTRSSTPGKAFAQVFDRIMEYGILRDGTKYLTNQLIHIINTDILDDFPSWRRFSTDYAETEYSWYLSGDRSIESIAKRAPLWNTMADGEGKVWSNYGYHWKKNDQLARVIQMLRNNPYTRRAVISHYDYNEMHNYENDTPCNMSLQFQYDEKGAIHITVFARSIDLVYGFCNDQYCFSRLLDYVCMELLADKGSMMFHIGNLHIYEKHYDLNKSI